MTTNKISHQQSKIKLGKDNLLAKVAGKFGGEFWLETQSEIEASRKKDKEEIDRLLDDSLNKQD